MKVRGNLGGIAEGCCCEIRSVPTLFCFDNKILLSLLYTEVINFIKIIIRDVCGGLGDCVNDYSKGGWDKHGNWGSVCWHVSFQLPYETDSVLV